MVDIIKDSRLTDMQPQPRHKAAGRWHDGLFSYDGAGRQKGSMICPIKASSRRFTVQSIVRGNRVKLILQ